MGACDNDNELLIELKVEETSFKALQKFVGTLCHWWQILNYFVLESVTASPKA